MKKPALAFGIIGVAVAVVATTGTMLMYITPLAAYAQTSSATNATQPSPSLFPPPITATAATNAITQETANTMGQIETECLAQGFAVCAPLIYESPTTVVLQGDAILTGLDEDRGLKYEANKLIWKTVDAFKARGFTIDSIVLAGQGTEPNPHVYDVVLSK